jgi:hypothetical protein
MENKARKFLKENYDIIVLEVYKKASVEYRSYLTKLIEQRNKLLEKDLNNKDLFYRYKSLEERISIMLSFLAISETTFDILSNKVFNHLNFDMYEWERYKWMEQRVEQWEQLYYQTIIKDDKGK